MTKVIFVCDESGAKGYADHEETYPGETGVFAGIMEPSDMDGIPETRKLRLANSLEDVFPKRLLLFSAEVGDM